tara:strand:- start:24 stop:3119 length:3096 start_codon:yes stop_codon:yes gene_type:complete
MALRFHSEFSNIRRELFKVEIYDSSFSGSSTEFTLRGNGFELAYNGGEETYQLIKSSTLSFVMNINNSTLKALPIDISATDSVSRFAVKLHRDDTYTAGNNYTPDGSNYELFWAGTINKRIMSIQDAGYPYDFRVSAVDGIEMLKNYTFKNSGANTIFESRISLVDYLVKVIDKLDFGNNFAPSDTVLATRINWFETNHSLSDSVAAKTYMYQSVFNSIDDNGEAKLSTYYDVLKHCCDLFQCRFMLYEGKFFYTQFSRLKESSNSYYLYKLNGSVGSPSSLTKTINDISGELGGVNSTGGSAATARSGFYLREKTYGQKISSVQIVWNALSDNSQNIYPLTYFPVWQMPNQGWTPYGQGEYGPNLSGYFESGDEISFRIKLKFSITISRDDTASASTPLGGNQFYGRVVLPFWFLAKDNGNVFPNYRWWRGQGGVNNPTGTFFNTPENEGTYSQGSWAFAADPYSSAMKFKTGTCILYDGSPSGTSHTFEFDVDLITGNVPVSEVDGVYLYNDYDGTWDSSLSSGDWFAIEDSSGNLSSAENWGGYTVTMNYAGENSLTVAPYQDGEPFLGSTFDSYVTEASSDSTNPEHLTIDTIKWGDGPSAIGHRTLWVDNGSNIIQSNLWQINNTGTTYKIHKLITDEILNYNYFSGERLNASIYQPLNLYAAQPLNISEGFNRDYIDEDGVTVQDELFAFSTLSYNPQMASWTFKGKKISIPPPTIVTTNPDILVDLIPKPPVISTSVNSLQDEDESCKLNQSLSPLDTGTTSLTVTAVSSDLATSSVLLIQSCSPGRQWEKITLSSGATKNDTSISINAFTPTFTYDETSRILVSRTTLVSSGGGGGGTPAGSNKQVQYNDSGSFGAEASFEYDASTNFLTADNIDGRHLGDNAGFRTKWSSTTSLLTYFLNPSDFNISSNSNVNIYSRDKGGSVVSSAYDSRSDDTMAFVNLPVGYKIKELIVYSNVNISFYLEYSSFNNDTIISVQSGGTTNSTLSLSSAETIDERRYYIVRVEYTATTDEIWGGSITLEKV